MFCERSSVVICVAAGTDDMAVPMLTPMYAPARQQNKVQTIELSTCNKVLHKRGMHLLGHHQMQIHSPCFSLGERTKCIIKQKSSLNHTLIVQTCMMPMLKYHEQNSNKLASTKREERNVL